MHLDPKCSLEEKDRICNSGEWRKRGVLLCQAGLALIPLAVTTWEEEVAASTDHWKGERSDKHSFIPPQSLCFNPWKTLIFFFFFYVSSLGAQLRGRKSVLGFESPEWTQEVPVIASKKKSMCSSTYFMIRVIVLFTACICTRTKHFGCVKSLLKRKITVFSLTSVSLSYSYVTHLVNKTKYGTLSLMLTSLT